MYRGNSSRIVPIILVLLVIAIAVAALVSVGRAIFGGNQPQSSAQNVGKEALTTIADSRSVRMTVRGPIVADETFRSYRITASTSTRSLTTYSGYLSRTLSNKSLSNNTRAYEELVYALDKANMMNSAPFEGNSDDTRGICATGRVYEFEVLKDGEVVQRLWTSTCKGSIGSFRASTEQVSSLFLEQIPDSKKILGKIDL